jgi:hypothetical protein
MLPVKRALSPSPPSRAARRSKSNTNNISSERDRIEPQRDLDLCSSPFPTSPTAADLPVGAETISTPTCSEQDALTPTENDLGDRMGWQSHPAATSGSSNDLLPATEAGASSPLDANIHDLADRIKEQKYLQGRGEPSTSLVRLKMQMVDLVRSKNGRSDDPPVPRNSRAHILNMPTEILQKILKPLFVCSGGSISISDMEMSRYMREEMSKQTFRTCRKMYAEGRALFYGKNIFSLGQVANSFCGPCSGLTPIGRTEMGLISSVEIFTEELEAGFFPPKEDVECVALIDAIRFYPYGDFDNVQSIHCSLDPFDDGKIVVRRHLGLSDEYDDLLWAFNDDDSNPSLRINRLLELQDMTNNNLVNWYAIVIAGTAKRECPQFTRMYRASQTIGSGRSREKLFSIVVCRDSERLLSVLEQIRSLDFDIVRNPTAAAMYLLMKAGGGTQCQPRRLPG